MLDALKDATVEDAMLASAITVPPTQRVERLRKAYLDLKPSASILRARIETRVMKETAGQPMITQRAKSLAASKSRGYKR